MAAERIFVHAHEVEPADGGARTGPRVNVLVSLNFPDMNDHVGDLVRCFTARAVAELAALDVDWRLLDTGTSLPGLEDALDADAVLVLGGGDVDSELYGVPGPVPHEYGVDVEADLFTRDAILGAIERHMPVLALCRGSQLLNLAFGGTLVPDLDPARDRGRRHATARDPAPTRVDCALRSPSGGCGGGACVASCGGCRRRRGRGDRAPDRMGDRRSVAPRG